MQSQALWFDAWIIYPFLKSISGKIYIMYRKKVTNLCLPGCGVNISVKNHRNKDKNDQNTAWKFDRLFNMANPRTASTLYGLFPAISLDWSKPAKPVPNLFEFPTILCALDLVRTEELELPSEKYCLQFIKSPDKLLETKCSSGYRSRRSVVWANNHIEDWRMAPRPQLQSTWALQVTDVPALKQFTTRQIGTRCGSSDESTDSSKQSCLMPGNHSTMDRSL